MVGRRNRGFGSQDSKRDGDDRPRDLENGPKPRHRIPRFRDIANIAIADRRKEDLKKQLKEGVDRDGLEKYRKSDEQLKEIKNKKVRKFYETQNERLNVWLEIDSLVMAMADDVLDSMNPDADHDGVHERSGALQGSGDNIEEILPEEERSKGRKAKRNARWAINVNIIANVLLLVAKIVAAFSSSSLSLIASLADSALDLLCTLIVYTTNRLVEWRLKSLKKRFPVGRKRLEPLGILVFSIIMIVSFMQILKESVEKLLPGEKKEAQALPAVAVGALLATIIVKGIIWFGCIRVKTTQVQALAQDCKTDVIFNTLSLLFPFIGHKANIWWFDPAGAGLLSLFIIYDWGQTCFENVTRLSGSAVDEALQKKLTYLAYRFSPLVGGFKSLTAYHAGDGVWAEIDVLLDEKMPLHRAHDIAETLQYCCEGLDEVDRAFVTTDYTSQGPTGHTSD